MIEEHDIPFLRVEISKLSPEAVAYLTGLCFLAAGQVITDDIDKADAVAGPHLDTVIRKHMAASADAYTKLSHAFHGRVGSPQTAARAEAIITQLRTLVPPEKNQDRATH